MAKKFDTILHTILKHRDSKLTIDMMNEQTEALEKARLGDTRCLETYLHKIYEKGPLLHSSDLHKIFDVVFADLHKMNCPDSRLIGILVKIRLENQCRLETFCWRMGSEQLQYFLSHYIRYYALHEDKKEWKENVASKMMNGPYSHSLIHEYFRHGQIRHLKIVLNHGFKVEYSDKQINSLKYIILCHWNKQPFSSPMDSECSSPELRYLLVFQILYAFGTVRRWCLDRFYEKYDVLNALQLIWRCVPVCYIPVFELKKIIGDLSNQEIIAAAIEDYAKSGILGSDNIHKPRLLQHYCRCRIRDCLTENLCLPEGVKHLGIPSHLKSYLLLER